MIDEQVHTAYHEAGHAVASCLLGAPFKYTTIIPKAGEYVGFIAQPLGENPSHQRLYDQMVILAASIVATTFLPNGYEGDEFLFGSGDDLEQMRLIAGYLANGDESEYERLFDRAHIRANELLRTSEHRAMVLCVAEALLEKQKMDCAEVQQIVNLTSQNEMKEE